VARTPQKNHELISMRKGVIPFYCVNSRNLDNPSEISFAWLLNFFSVCWNKPGHKILKLDYATSCLLFWISL